MSMRRRNRSPQARGNAALSGMADRPIRWIVDDAAKFAAREVRRGKRYDGIILDPPKFGRGPDGEVWRLEEDLPGLIADCRQLLDADSRASCSSPSMRCACRRWRSASCCASTSPTCPARSSAANWRCARKRAGCCCRPRSSRAGTVELCKRGHRAVSRSDNNGEVRSMREAAIVSTARTGDRQGLSRRVQRYRSAGARRRM